MRSISFDYNRIKSVGAGLLDKLAQLEYADFTKNSCIDEKAETKEAVEELKKDLATHCRSTSKRSDYKQAESAARL
jgi:hypothetical protein